MTSKMLKERIDLMVHSKFSSNRTGCLRENLFEFIAKKKETSWAPLPEANRQSTRVQLNVLPLYRKSIAMTSTTKHLDMLQMTPKKFSAFNPEVSDKKIFEENDKFWRLIVQQPLQRGEILMVSRIYEDLVALMRHTKLSYFWWQVPQNRETPLEPPSPGAFDKSSKK